MLLEEAACYSSSRLDPVVEARLAGQTGFSYIKAAASFSFAHMQPRNAAKTFATRKTVSSSLLVVILYYPAVKQTVAIEV